MYLKRIRDKLLWLPNWGLSLVSVVLIAILMKLFSEFDPNYGYLVNILLAPIACYVICRLKPYRVLFVLLICNFISILLMFDEGFLEKSGWIILSITWSLSIIATVLGRLTGRRDYDQFRT